MNEHNVNHLHRFIQSGGKVVGFAPCTLNYGDETIFDVPRELAFDGRLERLASQVLVLLKDGSQLGVAQSAQNAVEHRLVRPPLLHTSFLRVRRDRFRCVSSVGLNADL